MWIPIHQKAELKWLAKKGEREGERRGGKEEKGALLFSQRKSWKDSLDRIETKIYLLLFVLPLNH